MAATASAWAKPGAWALDAEENESELLQEHKQDYANDNSGGGGDTADFPSLAAAAATKAKKKKPQTLSLQEFSAYKPSQATAAKGLTPDELSALPTAPRQRSPEELDRNKLGGGFKSYGGYNERPSRDEQPRRQGSYNRDSNGEFGPSRADENDNWAAGKKFTASSGSERRERGGFFSDSQSRANESDNWGSNKAFVPSEPRRHERRGGFGLDSKTGGGGGADTDNWTKKKEDDGRKTGGAFDNSRERRGGVADTEAWGRKRDEESGGGIGGRPRLNLQPRTLPVGEEQKGENVIKSKGSSPFGEARPREEVLKEKGQDWKEIEEKLETTKIKEVGNGRARLQKEERAWRKSESVESRPESNEATESELVEATGNGSSEE